MKNEYYEQNDVKKVELLEEEK